MLRGYLGLVLELHHRLPAPGEAREPAWATAAAETYWPILRELVGAADAGLAEVATLAVSPAWIASATDPNARAAAAAELDRRADRERGGTEPEYWHALRRFAVDRFGHDPLSALRRAAESGAIEVIPLTSSHAWLPSVVDSPIVARAQVGAALAEIDQAIGIRAQGIWLPHLSYRPGFENVVAAFGARYFGVTAAAFRRGTVRSSVDIFGPLITLPGVAAFGVELSLTTLIDDQDRRYFRDSRYDDPATRSLAAREHADHFVGSWRDWAERAAPRHHGGEADVPSISVARISCHDLGSGRLGGADWLGRTFSLSADSQTWRATTFGRFLDRYPDGPVGRPGPSAGGIDSVRPADSDLMEHWRDAADLLGDLFARRDQLGPTARRGLSQATRFLLASQALDWNVPSATTLPPARGIAVAHARLDQFAQIAGLLFAGRLDLAALAQFEAGPPFLPTLDLDQLMPN